jgi:putative ABC transport system permease protein
VLRISALVKLYVGHLREKPGHELLAALGIAMGVALVFAVLVANSSIAGSVEQLVHGITGKASLEVAARDTHGFDQRLAAAVADTPGVTVAAPLLEQRVSLRGSHGQSVTVDLIGATVELAALDGPVTQAFGRRGVQLSRSLLMPSAVAHALGVRPDSTVILRTGSRSRRVPVGIVAGAALIGPLADSPVAVAPLAYAQDLTGRDQRLTRVLVRTKPGTTDQVRAELTRRLGGILNVRSSDSEARLIRQAASANDQSTTLFAAISAIVGILFAVNAMLLTVPRRRRLVRQLTLQGFGAGQLACLLIFEALVLGIASSILGLLLGDQLSRHLFHSVPGYLSFAFPVGGQRVVTATSVAVAVATGVLASLLAMGPAFRDAFAAQPARPGDAEGTSGRSGRWAWTAPAAGCLLVVATALVVLLAPEATIFGIGALVIGMLLLLPSILRGLIAVVWAAVSGTRVRSAAIRAGLAPVIVAVGELRGKTARGPAIAATIALAVFGSVAIEGAHGDLLRGLDGGAYGLTHSADLWIAPGGDVNTLTTMDFRRPAGLDAALRRVPGVANVRTYQGGFLDLPDRRVWAIGRPSGDRIIIPKGQVTEGDPVQAVQRIRRGDGWAAVSDVIAAKEHLHVGQHFELPTPAGQMRFRLAARLTNVGWPPGTIILNQRDYARAWLTSDPSAIEIDLKPGTSAVAVPAIRRIVGDSGAPLSVQTAGERWDLLRSNARQGLGRLTQIATLVLIGAIVSTALAMWASVRQRKPAIASSRVQGFGFLQLWASLLAEAALLLGFGSAIGAAFGLGGQLLLSRWLRLTTGFPTEYAPAIVLAVGLFAIVAAAALAVIAVPGYSAARTPMRVRFAAQD